MKNKIFAIIILTMLSLPISVWAVDDVAEQPQAQEENVINQRTDDEVEEPNIPETPYKQPVSKKKIVFKFLAAMCGVGVSSLVIYFGLSLYNRIRDGYINGVNTSDGEASLRTPDNMEEAVKTFLDKTKWD